MTRIDKTYQAAPDCLAERVILITGAGGGIGRAVSETCAAHGAMAVLAGRRVKSLEAAFDAIVESGAPEPVILPLDLAKASPGDYAELAGKLKEELGRLDGLVHVAARMDGLMPFRDVSADSWYHTLQVNLGAPYLMTQALLPLLASSGGGRVLFTLDDPATFNRAYWGAYAVSKAGLDSLMRVLADELESGATRVCGVRPRPVRSHLRSTVWVAEDPSELPAPDAVAGAFLALLDPAFDPEPGAVYEA